jgi:hypothetical protein
MKKKRALNVLAGALFGLVSSLPSCSSADVDLTQKTRTLPAQECPVVQPGGKVTNCDSACASAGMPCAEDCDVTCGFAALGNKHCTCADGVYAQCPCLRPKDLPVPMTGVPTCDVIFPGTNGFADPHDEEPCTPDQQWLACVGLDPNSGTPRGCLCVNTEWQCGSTNRWFAP